MQELCLPELSFLLKEMYFQISQVSSVNILSRRQQKARRLAPRYSYTSVKTCPGSAPSGNISRWVFPQLFQFPPEIYLFITLFCHDFVVTARDANFDWVWGRLKMIEIYRCIDSGLFRCTSPNKLSSTDRDFDIPRSFGCTEIYDRGRKNLP